MSLAAAFIAEIENEARATRRLLEVVPEEHFAWKPHEKSMALGRLAGHIAETANWGATMMASTELDMATASDTFKPFDPASRSELLAGFDEYHGALTSALAGKSDEELSVVWALRHGEKALFELPRHAAIRAWVLNHTVHHRGQLTVYLRLLGVSLPSVYGPTADARDFG